MLRGLIIENRDVQREIKSILEALNDFVRLEIENANTAVEITENHSLSDFIIIQCGNIEIIKLLNFRELLRNQVQNFELVVVGECHISVVIPG